MKHIQPTYIAIIQTGVLSYICYNYWNIQNVESVVLWNSLLGKQYNSIHLKHK